MRRPLSVVALVAVIGGAAWLGAFRDAGADATSAEAAQLVERMHEAPSSLQFSGVVRVTWRARGAPNDLTVAVTGDRGSIEVSSGKARVFDRGSRTYYKSEVGWSSALVEPAPHNVPAPDHQWDLGVRDGPEIVGRATQLVVAKRTNGRPAQRLYLDADTGLLLRRDVLDATGRVERSLEFLDLTVAADPALQEPSGVQTRRATPIADVPDGYEAPRAPSGYVLVARSRHEGGVELLYSDGLFSVTVFEQRGDLDWDGLPHGGVASEIGGNRARRYSEPNVDVLVWERDGIVFTAASDAPSDVIDAMIAEFSPTRSTAEKIADFVLGPFGWS
jgi:sigma-E factor negative regulatory protein RseB